MGSGIEFESQLLSFLNHEMLNKLHHLPEPQFSPLLYTGAIVPHLSGVSYALLLVSANNINGLIARQDLRFFSLCDLTPL